MVAKNGKEFYCASFDGLLFCVGDCKIRTNGPVQCQVIVTGNNNQFTVNMVPESSITANSETEEDEYEVIDRNVNEVEFSSSLELCATVAAESEIDRLSNCETNVKSVRSSGACFSRSSVVAQATDATDMAATDVDLLWKCETNVKSVHSSGACTSRSNIVAQATDDCCSINKKLVYSRRNQ